MKRAAAMTALLLLVGMPAAAQLGVDNPWPERRIVNIAHRGGALESPENTLFAYEVSEATGADVLEMDTYETSDGELVVIHDATVDRTTNGTGSVSAFTLEELRALDAAHWFVPGRGSVQGEPDDAYPYRGIATGKRSVPPELAAAGITPEHFRIPTLREILERFPDTWMVIELKPDPDSTGQYEQNLASLLTEFGRVDDLYIGSFLDHNMTIFKGLAPSVSTAPATAAVAAYWTTSQSELPGFIAGHHVFAVPPELGVRVVSQDFVDDAHAADMAVHVWTINDCDEMAELLRLGVDGIMTDAPSILEELLAQPDGAWNCSSIGAPDPTLPGPVHEDPAPQGEAGDLPASGAGAAAAGALVLAGVATVRRQARGSG